MAYDQTLSIANDTTVKTYYKSSLCYCVPKIYNIEVTDISDLLIGGNVVFKSNDQSGTQTAHKDAVFALINHLFYSDTP